MLPILNYSSSPQAGERAEAILVTLLRQKGFSTFSVYQPEVKAGGLPELDDNRRYQSALAVAKTSGKIYGVTGSMIEWRYKSGLDGDPVVSVSLRVVEVATGKVVWSASGARTGWGSDSLGGVAQSLLRDLVDRIRLADDET